MEIEYRDLEVFRYETGRDDGDEERCTYVSRASLHPSVKIGGASFGRCKNDVLPGMLMCYIHANRGAMAMAIRMYADKVKKLGGKI